MSQQFLLDTHVLVRWLSESDRLSKEQLRVLRQASRRGEPLGVSAITLMELTLLFRAGNARLSIKPNDVFWALENDPRFRIVPLTVEIAREVASVLSALRDPADSVIVATARMHGLRLVTSDQRILEANLVSVVG